MTSVPHPHCVHRDESYGAPNPHDKQPGHDDSPHWEAMTNVIYISVPDYRSEMKNTDELTNPDQ